MRNLAEHPITKAEIKGGLVQLAAKLLQDEIMGDMRPALLLAALE